MAGKAKLNPSREARPLNEGLLPYFFGIGQEDVPGLVESGRAVQGLFDRVYGRKKKQKRKARKKR